MRRKTKCPHTHFTRGKLVRVVLRDDSVIVEGDVIRCSVCKETFLDLATVNR